MSRHVAGIWRSHGNDGHLVALGAGGSRVVIWAVIRAAGSPGNGRGEESPETILKRRYARGEVDREDYERRLTDLRK